MARGRRPVTSDAAIRLLCLQLWRAGRWPSYETCVAHGVRCNAPRFFEARNEDWMAAVGIPQSWAQSARGGASG